MTRTLLSLSCLLCLTAVVPAQEDETGPLSFDERVRSVLQAGVEEMPSAQVWRLLGAPAIEVLVAIARDPDELPIYRERAAYALGHFPAPRVPGFLQELASQEAYGAGVRAQAMSALFNLDVDVAYSEFARGLVDEDAYLRRLAGTLLASRRESLAGELLDAAVERETVPHVRAALDKAAARQKLARARRNTDTLQVELTSTEGAGGEMFAFVVKAPEAPDAEDGLLRLDIAVRAPEGLTFEPATSWQVELRAGETWEVSVQVLHAKPDLITTFQVAILERGEELSLRLVSYPDLRQ